MSVGRPVELQYLRRVEGGLNECLQLNLGCLYECERKVGLSTGTGRCRRQKRESFDSLARGSQESPNGEPRLGFRRFPMALLLQPSLPSRASLPFFSRCTRCDSAPNEQSDLLSPFESTSSPADHSACRPTRSPSRSPSRPPPSTTSRSDQGGSFRPQA